MALGVLAADGQISPRALEGSAFVGELGLDGSLRRVPGILPLAAAIAEPYIVVPPACAREACLVRRATVRTVASLKALVEVLRTGRGWPELPPPVTAFEEPRSPDLAEVRGQAFGRQALEVAAAGGHHLLMVGRRLRQDDACDPPARVAAGAFAR